MFLESLILPDAKENDTTEVLGKLATLCHVQVEPAGRWFEVYCRRRQQKQTLSEHSLHSSSSDESDDDLSYIEDNETLLKTLDPKEWKDQDHYAVLGLAKMRYRTTTDQIKRAYKKCVLSHHPDKRSARGQPVKQGEEDYFTCITRAWETLGNPVKRRSYDSIDPQFDDSVPDKDEAEDDFFAVFTEVFERNARWTNKKRVPLLGDNNTPFEDVDNFYSFWYDFDSWREFSYLDEEEKEKGENRDERRWIEKQNKAARQKRKKEEIARVRLLVDNAYATDPRIRHHHEEKKLAKQREKDAKREAARQRAQEEEKKKQAVLDAERIEREKEEEIARAQAAVAKKEKEAQKKAFKRERKTLRNTVKEYDYFGDDDDRIQNMTDVDKLAELLSVLNLQQLNQELTSGDRERAKQAFKKEVKEMNERLEQEKLESVEKSKKQSSSGSSSSRSNKGNWSQEEVTYLIKGVNLFPAGTSQRWEAVAHFITQHCPGTVQRNPKEVLAKAKQLQSDDSVLKEEANKKAFDKFAQDKKGAAFLEKAEKEGLSERYVSVVEAQLMETGHNPAPWTPDEQKRLEQGLKTFPASLGADRWEKIAAALPQRSKKDCMMRYKELVKMVQAKKLAQIEAQKKAKKL